MLNTHYLGWKESCFCNWRTDNRILVWSHGKMLGIKEVVTCPGCNLALGVISHIADEIFHNKMNLHSQVSQSVVPYSTFVVRGSHYAPSERQNRTRGHSMLCFSMLSVHSKSLLSLQFLWFIASLCVRTGLHCMLWNLSQSPHRWVMGQRAGKKFPIQHIYVSVYHLRV